MNEENFSQFFGATKEKAISLEKAKKIANDEFLQIVEKQHKKKKKHRRAKPQTMNGYLYNVTKLPKFSKDISRNHAKDENTPNSTHSNFSFMATNFLAISSGRNTPRGLIASENKKVEPSSYSSSSSSSSSRSGSSSSSSSNSKQSSSSSGS